MICATTGKQCHTKAAARAHALHLKRASVTNRAIDVYRCEDYRSHRQEPYHVGHRPSPRTRKQRWKPGAL